MTKANKFGSLNNLSLLGSLALVVGLSLAMLLAPNEPIDPWGLINLHKTLQLILALAVIHLAGAALANWLGPRAGTVATGFLGGLVSSTALIASVARHSASQKRSPWAQREMHPLLYLSATGAMLVEAMVLCLIGTRDSHWQFLVIFAGPFAVTMLMLKRGFHRANGARPSQDAEIGLDVLGLIKLSVFILGVLALSKFAQTLFGDAGLLVLTFLISLFEIHGSLIANLQLHESGFIGVRFLGSLIIASIAASYVSKVALAAALGSREFKWSVLRWTALVLASLIVSGAAFLLLPNQ